MKPRVPPAPTGRPIPAQGNALRQTSARTFPSPNGAAPYQPTATPWGYVRPHLRKP